MQEMGLRQEVSALSVHTKGRIALAAHEDLRQLGLGTVFLVGLELLVGLAPARVRSLPPIQ